MTDEFWKILIPAAVAAIPATIAATAALVVAFRGHKQVTYLHELINSRLTQWMENAQGISRAEGKAEGVEAERARRAEE